MDKYCNSLKELKKKIKENEDLTEKQWDEYARNNGYYSAFTIKAHRDVITWMELKANLKKMDKRIEKNIEKMKKQLNETIEKFGIQSKQTRKINEEINKQILLLYEMKENVYKSKEKLYEEKNIIYQNYKESICIIKDLAKQEKRFLTVKEWNKYAKNANLLSSQSIEYISGKSWNEIREEVLRRK